MSSVLSQSPSDERSFTEQTETLVEAALRILNTADPVEKAKLGEAVATRWHQGFISEPYHQSLDFHVPDRPARPSNVNKIRKITSLSAEFSKDICFCSFFFLFY